jgi:hypothetical protein
LAKTVFSPAAKVAAPATAPCKKRRRSIESFLDLAMFGPSGLVFITITVAGRPESILPQ